MTLSSFVLLTLPTSFAFLNSLIFLIPNLLFQTTPSSVKIGTAIGVVLQSISFPCLLPLLFLFLLVPLSFFSVLFLFMVGLFLLVTFTALRHPHQIFTLSSTLSSLPYSIISNLLLVGDFNVDFSSTSSLSCPLFNTLHDLKDSFSLSQVITEPNSLLSIWLSFSLAFIPSTMSSACCILPPLSTSDHQCILLTVPQPKTCSFQSFTPRRHVWLYKHADTDKMNDLLDSISWDSILSDNFLGSF